jgi:hypothetical protein
MGKEGRKTQWIGDRLLYCLQSPLYLTLSTIGTDEVTSTALASKTSRYGGNFVANAALLLLPSTRIRLRRCFKRQDLVDRGDSSTPAAIRTRTLHEMSASCPTQEAYPNS